MLKNTNAGIETTNTKKNISEQLMLDTLPVSQTLKRLKQLAFMGFNNL